MSTMTAEHSAKKQCGCGCDSKPDCCELECLVQPRFFCGQLLADQDLTALVDWVKAKTGLARYRHGWGIVCGLDVHCGRNGTVKVTPGYALDCCGRDVVVCEETTFDLTGCWQRPEDPCGNGALRRNRNQQVLAAAHESGTWTDGSSSFGGFEIPPEELQAIDLYIRYSESETDARTALARGGCGGTAGCEYTRVHEGYELYCKPAPDCLDPNEEVVAAWEGGYVQGLTEMFDAFHAMAGLQEPRRRLGRLLAWLKEHPPNTFCYVHEWLCDLQSDEETPLPDRWFDQAVFLIVQDWRNAYFRASCAGCGPDTGIRLARVWLWMRRVENKEKFSTLYVDAYLPFRRLLAKDDYPARDGYVNMAPYIWQPADRASLSLRDLGFTDIQLREFGFPDLIALRSTFVHQNSLFIQHNADSLPRLFLYYYTDHCNTRRVVGFSTPAILAEPIDPNTGTTRPGTGTALGPGNPGAMDTPATRSRPRKR